MPLRDRVLELRRVPARYLRAHPLNHRRHPDSQRQALHALLAEIGFAGALLAREAGDGTLELIDGHLRAETAPDQELPVLVVDLNASEAALLLATFDSIGAMAEKDPAAFRALMGHIQTENPAVQALVGHLAAGMPEKGSAARTSPTGRGSHASADEVGESYQVVAHCADEETQEELYEELTNRGYRCRVLTM